MQQALCTSDGETWEAREFSRLPEDELQQKRGALLCTQCDQFAWFRKASSHGHPPHFCAHHSENCELKVEYVVSEDTRDIPDDEVDRVDANDVITVNIDEERQGEVNVPNPPANPQEGGFGGGVAYIRNINPRDANQSSTLRRILLRLVQSERFRESTMELVLLRQNGDELIRGRIRDIVENFADIDVENDRDRLAVYWGPIANARSTDDGKIWLNSSARYQDTSISIFEDVAEEFLDQFGIEDLEELAGAYVLVIGSCRISQSGKPIIWCGSPKFIMVRRYRAENLRNNGE